MQHNLLPHQLIQATVVESADRQVLLDMGKQQLRAQTDVEMRSGQKLNLQVVATHPRLTFQVVSPSANNQLLHLLHMYDHHSEIGSALSTLLGQRATASSMPTQTALPGGAGAATATVNAPPADGSSAEGAAPPLTSPAAGPVAPAAAPPSLASTVQYKGLPLTTAAGLLPLTAEQRQLVEAALSPQQWSQLEQLSSKLLSNFQDSGARLLFDLARNLGLDFESLLAQDQAQQASQSLKGALLALNSQADLPEVVRESSQQLVQQLELLQLTRVRLAQEGILFLPLPFEFMEQGYVLVEQGGSGTEADAQCHLVTLNMSLQELGPLQVNLLFEQQSLFVRILCDGESCQAVLEQSREELQQVLSPFSVRSIQITQGAEDPAVALLNRLKPEQDSVLDERV
ncbi:MAG: hypothetical protein J7K75_12370 [Desulfuromonas sp.]|nr:hypothetical protein [Desulfuromonas sp.]